MGCTISVVPVHVRVFRIFFTALKNVLVTETCPLCFAQVKGSGGGKGKGGFKGGGGRGGGGRGGGIEPFRKHNAPRDDAPPEGAENWGAGLMFV